MSQIDIKEAIVKLFDGTKGTLTSDSTPADSDLVWTAVSKHIGSDKISITMVDPAVATQALSIVVTGRDIVINLETAVSSIVSTALEVKTAIDADSDASALVTVALETAGAGVVEAQILATLDGQKSLTVKVGEGNLSYNEHRNVEFTRDRGIIDTVRLADEEPMDVSLDVMWEWISSVAGSSTPEVQDVLKNINEASTWITTADDTCQPFCIDIEVHNDTNCTGVEDELLMFEEFYYETLDHDLREGTFSVAGRCNRKVATARRVLAPAIP